MAHWAEDPTLATPKLLGNVQTAEALIAEMLGIEKIPWPQTARQ
jgi:hypothetical protein